MSYLDAHLILNIFLPPLIFESAFSMEWRVFDQCKWYCVWLAGPCMIIATLATGSLVNLLVMPRGSRFYSFPASVLDGTRGTDGCATDAWSDMSGYMLGVILSATDPVAVVAILKELGLRPRLLVGIEGGGHRPSSHFDTLCPPPLRGAPSPPASPPFEPRASPLRRISAQRRHGDRNLRAAAQDAAGCALLLPRRQLHAVPCGIDLRVR